jgi:hypothetical protein
MNGGAEPRRKTERRIPRQARNDNGRQIAGATTMADGRVPSLRNKVNVENDVRRYKNKIKIKTKRRI